MEKSFQIKRKKINHHFLSNDYETWIEWQEKKERIQNTT